jgi:hypothetical protein
MISNVLHFTSILMSLHSEWILEKCTMLIFKTAPRVKCTCWVLHFYCLGGVFGDKFNKALYTLIDNKTIKLENWEFRRIKLIFFHIFNKLKSSLISHWKFFVVKPGLTSRLPLKWCILKFNLLFFSVRRNKKIFVIYCWRIPSSDTFSPSFFFFDFNEV